MRQRKSHVRVKPGLQVRILAFRSSNDSCANCGSSLTLILYRRTINVNIAMPSVSKNLRAEVDGTLDPSIKSSWQAAHLRPRHARAPNQVTTCHAKLRSTTYQHWRARRHLVANLRGNETAWKTLDLSSNALRCSRVRVISPEYRKTSDDCDAGLQRRYWWHFLWGQEPWFCGHVYWKLSTLYPPHSLSGFQEPVTRVSLVRRADRYKIFEQEGTSVKFRKRLYNSNVNQLFQYDMQAKHTP